jgi:hypothetical protein
VVAQVVGLTAGVSTADVDFAIDDCDTHVVSCKRHRRFTGPLIGGRVIDFVHVEWLWVEAVRKRFSSPRNGTQPVAVHVDTAVSACFLPLRVCSQPWRNLGPR